MRLRFLMGVRHGSSPSSSRRSNAQSTAAASYGIPWIRSKTASPVSLQTTASRWNRHERAQWLLFHPLPDECIDALFAAYWTDDWRRLNSELIIFDLNKTLLIGSVPCLVLRNFDFMDDLVAINAVGASAPWLSPRAVPRTLPVAHGQWLARSSKYASAFAASGSGDLSAIAPAMGMLSRPPHFPHLKLLSEVVLLVEVPAVRLLRIASDA